MAKRVYKGLPLYEIWLALDYAYCLACDYVSDMEAELKEARKHRAKMKRNLAKAASQYEEIEGRSPDRKLGK